MSFSPKPCAHCGNLTFCFLPHMQIPVATASTVLGMNASMQVKGRYWTFTLVVCTQCGCTQTFTTNTQQLAGFVPGSNVATVTPR